MFTIYNYADDNTEAFIHKNFIFKLVLKAESFNLISWFGDNFIKTNPDKFQSIYVGKKTNDNIKSFRIGDTDITRDITCTCENNVSSLGIDIDFMLTFHEHVADICKKASKQLANKKTRQIFPQTR